MSNHLSNFSCSTVNVPMFTSRLKDSAIFDALSWVRWTCALDFLKLLHKPIGYKDYPDGKGRGVGSSLALKWKLLQSLYYANFQRWGMEAMRLFYDYVFPFDLFKYMSPFAWGLLSNKIFCTLVRLPIILLHIMWSRGGGVPPLEFAKLNITDITGNEKICYYLRLEPPGKNFWIRTWYI